MKMQNEQTGASNRYVLLFGFIMLVGLLFLAWLGSPPRITAVGQPLPGLDLQPLVNTDQSLDGRELSGKITLLHFWGTWCGPCQVEYPEFDALAAKYLDHPEVMIVSVSSSPGLENDVPALKSKTTEFLANFQTPIPTYADSVAMTRSSIGLLLPGGTFSYPTTLLVDRQGTIVEALVGSLPGDMERLSKKIQDML
jgi:cytochrome c biogenesis protein CcmG, thiol:disulfide interchange protein DsbE